MILKGPPGSSRRLTAYSLVALSLVLLNAPLFAQKGVAPKASLPAWATASQRWLQGQVTPNRLVPDPDPGRRRLLISYDIPPAKSPRTFHRSATYDNALAALAFFIAGERERAAFTLHAVARVVRPDGSLWAGYNTANNWPDEKDHDSAIVRAGAVGWAGYALTFYLAHEPPCGDQGCERERAFFLETAARLANYLLSLQVNDRASRSDGLLRLGFGNVTLAYRADTNSVVEVYKAQTALGISAENNISAWFFLRQLAALTGEARWTQTAERIRDALLRVAWNDALGQFNQGFDSNGAPDSSKALDCASWGALFALANGETEKARKALEVIDGYYATRDGKVTGYRPYSDLPVYEDPQVGKFFFPDTPRKEWRELPLVWSEGTLGVALACLRLGHADRARRILAGLEALQMKDSGLRCASAAVPFQMAEEPCVAASAWLFLVAEGLAGNPTAEQIWK